MATTLMHNHQALERFSQSPSLIHAPSAQQVLAMANTDVRNKANTEAALAEMAGVYGVSPFSASGKSFIYGGGIAVIPVWGALLHRDRWCSSWATGYGYIEAAMTEALADDDVKGIVWDINSYGGHVAGNFELCEMIAAARGRKPMVAIVDARALSGGYSVASAVGRIVATPSADIGSIGVVLMHMSFEKMLDEAGIKATFIFAGDHKVDGNPYEDLPDGVRKRLQTEVDRSYKDFVSLVATNRGIDETAVKDTQASVYGADEAKALGLIDDVMQPRAAFAAFQAELEKGSTLSPKKEAKKMTDNTEKTGEGAITQTDLDKAASAARAAEQKRIGAITTHAEATGREKLANHLAFNTSMSAEDATALLAVSPKGAEAPVEPEKTAEAPPVNRLAAALEGEANKTVGVDGGKEKEGDQGNRGDRLCADFQAFTGRKAK